ncbi:MAG TPA: dUTP diphosphatase [Thermoanaerobaculia bacterium]|nr:dUTP diphosphatase [Thermoanaerobaculia bacterium]
MRAVKIAVVNRCSDLPLPERASPHAAGFDLRAAVDAPLVLEPGGRELVPTGLTFAIPSGHEGQVRPRSGLAIRHGITVLNAPGTIDADYRGEVKVILINHGTESFTIQRGDRIAQLVIAPAIACELEGAETIDETTRGAGGFGSSGR